MSCHALSGAFPALSPLEGMSPPPHPPHPRQAVYKDVPPGAIPKGMTFLKF